MYNKLVNKAAVECSRLTWLHKEITVSRGQHKVDRFTIVHAVCSLDVHGLQFKVDEAVACHF